jgi:hypothetical protein
MVWFSFATMRWLIGGSGSAERTVSAAVAMAAMAAKVRNACWIIMPIPRRSVGSSIGL